MLGKWIKQLNFAQSERVFMLLEAGPPFVYPPAISK